MITDYNQLNKTGNQQCYMTAWMGGEFGREWIHRYVWLSPYAIPEIVTVNSLHSSIKEKVKKEKNRKPGTKRAYVCTRCRHRYRYRQ